MIQYNMQKLFMFPVIFLFHPNNVDRQNLKIEETLIKRKITKTESKSIERA